MSGNFAAETWKRIVSNLQVLFAETTGHAGYVVRAYGSNLVAEQVVLVYDKALFNMRRRVPLGKFKIVSVAAASA